MAESKAEVKVTEVAHEHDDFADIEDKFKASLNNQIACYNKERIEKGLRTTTFRLTKIEAISNPALESRFQTAKTRLKSLGREGKELKVQRGFHGTRPANLLKIAQKMAGSGLLTKESISVDMQVLFWFHSF
jgi:hypothetical protein